jgi:hypothetical protein
VSLLLRDQVCVHCNKQFNTVVFDDDGLTENYFYFGLCAPMNITCSLRCECQHRWRNWIKISYPRSSYDKWRVSKKQNKFTTMDLTHPDDRIRKRSERELLRTQELSKLLNGESK